MSANLEEVLVTARTFPNALALPVSALIGELEVQTNIEEIHTDTLEITEHPVERGASIADHAYKKPAEVVLRCGWSNSSLKALLGIITGFFAGGTMSKADFVSGVYSQLLQLQESREPMSVTTGLRQYDNMLIRSLVATRDQKTAHVLMVTATFREVIIVTTQAATLPAKDSQADPAGTAELENTGVQQVYPVSPGPGGSVPPNEW